MIRISIFVAGAKKLSKQRLLLKALANDLSDEFNNHKKYDCSITVKTYENFNDKQNEYNEFIENKADLVLFVLEDKIGKNTEEEYILATKKFLKCGHPTIMVFLKSFTVHTPEITHVESLINGTLDKYYVEYKNNEELVAKARERLRIFIQQTINTQQRNLIASIRNNKRIVIGSALSAVIVSLLMFCCSWFYFNKNYPRQILLLAGGGSAFNYVEKNYLSVKGDPTFVYTNMPSGMSWQMLWEDILSKKTSIEESKENRYYTICLSASKLDTEKLGPFPTNDGNIIEYNIGTDPLVVWAKRCPELLNYVPDTTSHIITSVQLANILNDSDNVSVLTTKENSGTFVSYKTVLGNDLQFKGNMVFSEGMDVTKLPEGAYVLLGSQYYTKIDKYSKKPLPELIPLTLLHNGQPISKDIYIYFNAYCVSNSELWIPDVTLRFIKQVIPENVLNAKLKNKNRITRRTNQSAVVSFTDDLL